MRKAPMKDRESQVWSFVLGYFSDNGYMPTRGEIAESIGTTNQYADQVLRNLQKKGYVQLSRNWRGIEIIDDNQE